MTVAELLARISSKELSEWMVFSQVEPFGADAGYLGHAITASTIANANRQKGHKPYEVEEFMPKFKKKKKQSVDQMIQMAQMFTTAAGGQIGDKDR
jgi:hypothetical protein